MLKINLVLTQKLNTNDFFQIDLIDIADAYEEMFERTLHSAIKSETSGDYCRLLLRLLGDHP